MHISSLILPLITLSSTLAVAHTSHNGRRSLHPDPNVHERAASIANAQGAPGKVKVKRAKKTGKGKRSGKKKRACQVPLKGSNATSIQSSVSFHANGSASSYIVSSAAPSPSSSSASWSSAVSSATSSAVPSSVSSAAPAASSSAGGSTGNSDWTLVQAISGSNFFDSWTFWSWDDPTHGTVEYVDSTTAWNEGLVSINSANHAIMSVDTTPQVSGGRKSIRISSDLTWTGGMVLMDAVHMPTGCGTWPAWWQNGPNWPQGGEIDIVEGVNMFTQNQVSLHTGDGCSMPSDINSLQTGTLYPGNGFNSFDCASDETSNQGCGVQAAGDYTSYGSGFNSVGGGVYAMVWDKQGISVWWFTRNSIPADITNETPDPTTWGTPMAHFPPDDCNPYTFFYDHYNIFDTTLCGDWAGNSGTWNNAGYAGQSQSCAALTGYSTCSDYVLNQGGDFTEAYWEVSYVKYFNSTTLV